MLLYILVLAFAFQADPSVSATLAIEEKTEGNIYTQQMDTQKLEKDNVYDTSTLRDTINNSKIDSLDIKRDLLQALNLVESEDDATILRNAIRDATRLKLVTNEDTQNDLIILFLDGNSLKKYQEFTPYLVTAVNIQNSSLDEDLKNVFYAKLDKAIKKDGESLSNVKEDLQSAIDLETNDDDENYQNEAVSSSIQTGATALLPKKTIYLTESLEPIALSDYSAPTAAKTKTKKLNLSSKATADTLSKKTVFYRSTIATSTETTLSQPTTYKAQPIAVESFQVETAAYVIGASGFVAAIAGIFYFKRRSTKIESTAKNNTEDHAKQLKEEMKRFDAVGKPRDEGVDRFSVYKAGRSVGYIYKEKKSDV